MDIDSRIDAVWQALEEGAYQEAGVLAAPLLRDHPDDSEALLVCAAVAYHQEDATAALELARACQQREQALDRPAGEDTPWLAARRIAALALYQLWRSPEANREAEAVTTEHPSDGEMWYLLAQIAELQGDFSGAEQAYQAAARCDPERWGVPDRLTAAQMEEAVQSARADLPEAFRRVLDELPVIIEPLPNMELAAAESEQEPPLPPDILGLFVGTNMLDRSVFNPLESPGVIFLFQRCLERACLDRETLVEEIRITLWHELAHYLGFDEEQMDNIGLA